MKRRHNTELRFDYRDPETLRRYMTEHSRIVPRRMNGLTAKQQRDLTTEIKRARQLALLPYDSKGF